MQRRTRQLAAVGALSALVAVALGAFADHGDARLARAAVYCFLAGSLLFSGSLYTLALTGIGAFGAVTPGGGVLFLVGWALLAASLLRRPAAPDG